MTKKIALATHDILSAPIKKNGRLGKETWIGCARTWEDGDIELTFDKPLIHGWRIYLRAVKT